jgi:hypothetical protein
MIDPTAIERRTVQRSLNESRSGVILYDVCIYVLNPGAGGREPHWEFDGVEGPYTSADLKRFGYARLPHKELDGVPLTSLEIDRILGNVDIGEVDWRPGQAIPEDFLS